MGKDISNNSNKGRAGVAILISEKKRDLKSKSYETKKDII